MKNGIASVLILLAASLCSTILFQSAHELACAAEVVDANDIGETEREGGVRWGNIDFYTDSYIVVNGARYDYVKHVTIDTFTLKADKRGNVSLTLDTRGKVTQVFFYGIDMPDAFRRFRR